MRLSSSSFPSKCLPAYWRKGGGKYSRIFRRASSPTQARRTSRTGVAKILGFSSPIRRSSVSIGKLQTGGRRGPVADNALAVAITVPHPDWRSVTSLAVDAVSSAHSKRAYAKALKDFLAWYSAEARPPFSRAVVQQYRSLL